MYGKWSLEDAVDLMNTTERPGLQSRLCTSNKSMNHFLMYPLHSIHLNPIGLSPVQMGASVPGQFELISGDF